MRERGKETETGDILIVLVESYTAGFGTVAQDEMRTLAEDEQQGSPDLFLNPAAFLCDK